MSTGANDKLTYTGSGVNYDLMDPFKRQAQLAARETANTLLRFGYKEIEASRGESAYLVDIGNMILAIVEEGLGTKNIVADNYDEAQTRSSYATIAQDTVAMIVNDMITLGALPVSVAMHLAVGDSRWFNDATRVEALVEGWKNACIASGCTWGCGETPTLKGIINPDHAVLSGSAVGIIRDKSKMIIPRIADNDAILFAESLGINANGLTLARAIADRTDSPFKILANLLFPKKFPLRELAYGYDTELPDGQTYGEALLQPTHLYVKLIEACQEADVDLHYLVNITGHGWRKLMRAPGLFTYIVTELPTKREIFEFMIKHGPMDRKEAYGNLNMGAGFALYVPQSDVQKVISISKEINTPYRVYQAGYIKESKQRTVVIKPENITFKGEELQVR